MLRIGWLLEVLFYRIVKMGRSLSPPLQQSPRAQRAVASYPLSSLPNDHRRDGSCHAEVIDLTSNEDQLTSMPASIALPSPTPIMDYGGLPPPFTRYPSPPSNKGGQPTIFTATNALPFSHGGEYLSTYSNKNYWLNKH